MVSKGWEQVKKEFGVGENRTKDNIIKKGAYICAASNFYHPTIIADGLGLHRTSVLHHTKKHQDNLLYEDYRECFIRALDIVNAVEKSEPFESLIK